jgi:hypothetical protein
MAGKKSDALRCSFQFDYKVKTQGVPQPYPIAEPNSRILIRFSTAEGENGRTRQVLNICGTREGLKYLAAMLVLCADSEKYDPEFHIHLEDLEEVETDIEVAVRAPVYLEMLRKGEFSEAKGTSISIPPRRKLPRGVKSKRSSSSPRPRKPKPRTPQ